ncbi:MAG: aminoacyl-tRNA hydrolase [Flavobacteriales bacterium CG_4_9_14_0_2_um_filter_35_242]|nr:aminoacyl-tRNA hydrolase [Zetaproteobacteria bacterium]OIO12869.1 MAG: aminoacyl-tRNA hydrolase [Flavobacteriaceae bacterium CG1_02_35_72]PIR14236.1 MAG: aminoacyl-tRNA hydrolase [Flavobacteriales bacterium CG11_big_fil_rev_8_21_14_0_20_35_7]PIV17267.1 MAG: aminoacyl-tRNA hydrolase [Flavobacteriales bacterium CG03_land_8_20_14_0_80_35_15]PIX06991.1 MAG: aminoacyl-tRNA hydrolase [Flavobacteriales bacterium CG_4_8_14_3_um_filter_35_10]PJA06007.1 MAG: aminoacyl-tRNA hydrolase [Flavobacteriales
MLTELLSELKFKATRSSGAGGQHVNKVSSKIECVFDLVNSQALTEDQKQLLLKNSASRLTKDFKLILTCDESRSQHKNKELVIERFLQIIKKGLTIPKKRTPTKIGKSVVEKRKEKKKKQAYKKALRQNPKLD